MLPLKAIIKTFRTSLLYIPYKLSEETTQRKHTRTLQLFLAKNMTLAKSSSLTGRLSFIIVAVTAVITVAVTVVITVAVITVITVITVAVTDNLSHLK